MNGSVAGALEQEGNLPCMRSETALGDALGHGHSVGTTGNNLINRRLDGLKTGHRSDAAGNRMIDGDCHHLVALGVDETTHTDFFT